MPAILQRLSWVQGATIAVLGSAAVSVLAIEGFSAPTVPTAVGLVICGALGLVALFGPGLTVPVALVSVLFSVVCAQLPTRPDNTFGLVELAAFSWLVVRIVMVQPIRRAWWISGLLAIAGVLLPLRLDAGSDGYKAFMIPVIGLGMAFMVLLGLYLRLHDRQRAGSFELARQAQRLEYARDLHDFVAHHVTAIVAQAKAVRYTTAAGQPPSAEVLDSMLESIEKAGSEALVSMRGMITVLRGDQQSPDRRTLGDVLDAAVQHYSGPPIAASLDEGLAGLRLPQRTLDAVQHVVQESLTNVLRHAADVGRVEINARVRDGELEISVANDGTRASEPGLPSGGFGLVGLRERVADAGGRLSAGPDGTGWRVTATLPSVARPSALPSSPA